MESVNMFAELYQRFILQVENLVFRYKLDIWKNDNLLRRDYPWPGTCQGRNLGPETRDYPGPDRTFMAILVSNKQ